MFRTKTVLRIHAKDDMTSSRRCTPENRVYVMGIELVGFSAELALATGGGNKRQAERAKGNILRLRIESLWYCRCGVAHIPGPLGFSPRWSGKDYLVPTQPRRPAKQKRAYQPADHSDRLFLPRGIIM